ncbi:MAG: aspartate aminotransferase family protein [Bacteroidota bacterium]
MKNHFFAHQAQTTPYPLAIEIERAEGVWLYGPEDRKYIDLISGIAVNNIGHCHPKVVKAVQEQAAKYMHVMAYGEYVQAPQAGFAAKLASVLPDTLDCVYFTNSGTEATEGALKLAKRATGRSHIVSFKKSYHGSTHGSLSVTGNETKKYAFRPLLPNVSFIAFNEETELDAITKQTACVIMETIQGDAGVRIPSMAFMQALRKKCTETGALLILDEIQTGFGRTGKLFAFEHFGIVPDILTIGKAMGGGMHMGGFVSSRNLMHELTFNPILGHITTFGGHPVACAAGLAGLEVVLEEKLVDSCEEKGAWLEEQLHHPLVKEIRRKGMMFAIEMENANVVQQVVSRCLENGAITFWFLSCPESFRLAPPLTISRAESEIAVGIIREAMDHVLTHPQ